MSPVLVRASVGGAAMKASLKWNPITRMITWIVGQAARERLERAGRWEYVGCRRDCICVRPSAITRCIAFGEGAE